VFSSIDRQGRYAYANQPHAALWNLARFAETLLPIIDSKPDRAVELATEVVTAFSARFAERSLTGMRRKLGLSTSEEGDSALIEALLDAMHRNQADFTLTFRALCAAAEAEAGAAQAGGAQAVDAQLGEAQLGDARARALFANPRDYDAWAVKWRERLGREASGPMERAAAMRRVNPAVIPRNHRIERVIRAAVDAQDFAPFAEMSAVLSQPYDPLEGFDSYADPPQPSERVLQTFCGT
jgi:uncharacterized protein YdiU (UPF0061 family)